MKKKALKILPWIITILACFYAFKGIDWSEISEIIFTGNPLYICLAVLATIISYFLRSWRWKFFFPEKQIKLINAYKVLILGFFMNNVLPARAGEFVRAHMGAKVTGAKRTLVLATIASERLTDGLVLSGMFILVAIGSTFSGNSKNLLYVANLFFIAGFSVIILLYFRRSFFALLEKIEARGGHKIISYISSRLKIFINGLLPLVNVKRFPILCFSSISVWLVELLAYYLITVAFNADLSLTNCIIFLVAINFSSLIPSAPAGIGVIEAVATAVLVAVGINRELALSMVILQHVIQILVIGVQGGLVMLTWNLHLKDFQEISDND